MSRCVESGIVGKDKPIKSAIRQKRYMRIKPKRL